MEAEYVTATGSALANSASAASMPPPLMMTSASGALSVCTHSALITEAAPTPAGVSAPNCVNRRTSAAACGISCSRAAGLPRCQPVQHAESFLRGAMRGQIAPREPTSASTAPAATRRSICGPSSKAMYTSSSLGAHLQRLQVLVPAQHVHNLGDDDGHVRRVPRAERVVTGNVPSDDVNQRLHRGRHGSRRVAPLRKLCELFNGALGGHGGAARLADRVLPAVAPAQVAQRPRGVARDPGRRVVQREH